MRRESFDDALHRVLGLTTFVDILLVQHVCLRETPPLVVLGTEPQQLQFWSSRNQG
jgi:hypothetical protein